MHTNETRKLVSSQTAGPAAHESTAGKSSARRVWRLASPFQRAIPLTSHRYQQAAAAETLRRTHILFLPAAGNRWNGELNNAGSNGNYWSSTLNESNPNNGYELNFNSGNANWNNNNRNNGQSVRPVR